MFLAAVRREYSFAATREQVYDVRPVGYQEAITQAVDKLGIYHCVPTLEQHLHPPKPHHK